MGNFILPRQPGFIRAVDEVEFAPFWVRCQTPGHYYRPHTTLGSSDYIGKYCSEGSRLIGFVLDAEQLTSDLSAPSHPLSDQLVSEAGCLPMGYAHQSK